ncbi:flagellar protein FliT [Paenibacillus hexagrammi]|uniref:Flagellar protein FliT n=1 Tax=Paenibacillus hexagrammi TaxID=2908839 RepID=A0ABY3SGX5_9BACL|nr:flagellar protein FliT [Paenibacillus sp. YPD9-1]UJF33191.1 hypothetical protein L0M14_27255 [Paenibacillus sp. YPD9-1]
MHSLIERLYVMTKESVDRLHEATAEEIVQFIEEREMAIDRIRAESTELSLDEENRKTIDKIVAMDKLIENRLVLLQNQVKKQLNQTVQHRKVTAKYVNPYSADSFFFDKKK